MYRPVRKKLPLRFRLLSRAMSRNNLPFYFENAAGHVQAHPQEYVLVCYYAGRRQGTDLAALLTHAGNLLRTQKWNCLLSDQRLMAPYTPVEEAWVHAYWDSQQAGCAEKLYLAVVVAPAA